MSSNLSDINLENFPSINEPPKDIRMPFQDLEEISTPEQVYFDACSKVIINIPIIKTISNKIPSSKNQLIKDKIEMTIKDSKKEESIKQDKLEVKDAIEKKDKEVEEVEKIEELQEVEELKTTDDDINNLIQNIDKFDESIKYPGEIKLTSIDNSLQNPNIDYEKVKTNSSDEAFGVNRVEVFYNIDKQIYSTRSSSFINKEKIRRIKKGFFLPSLVTLSSFIFLLIVGVLLSFYFKATSNVTLEENVINDKSILAKIAQQKEEEAKLAGKRLEEERKKLEEEKKTMQSTINEELLKKQAEIENKYKQKMEDLKKSGISQDEVNKLKQEYDKEKEKALIQAKSENNSEIEKQNKLLAEKDNKLKEALNTLQQASENKESELQKIKEEYETRKQEELKQIEQANIKLKEIRDNEEKIKSFNSTVYQLISTAMTEFKNQNYDPASTKLNAVLNYYNSRIDFVMNNPELKNKMDTDIFFVNSITNLIENSKNTIGSNSEYIKIINKFDKAAEYYKNGEKYYNEKKYNDSGKEYEKVLQVFQEINTSYQKLKDLEKQTQNISAIQYYNQAAENMKNKKYDVAINQFSAVIKQSPLSDYTSQALNNIIKIADTISYTEKVNKDNENAKLVFLKADDNEKNKKYSEALKLYNQVITDYPFSDYTKKSLEKINILTEALNKSQLQSNYDNTLKSKFQDDFKKYLDYNKQGDVYNARKYYFSALRNAFDIYANNSIDDFKQTEDKYIETLLKNSSSKTLEENKKAQEEYLKIKLEEAQKNLKDKYDKEIAEQKIRLDQLEKDKKDIVDKYEKEKKELNEKYTSLQNKYDTNSANQKKDQISKYEEQLKAKDAEITKYRKYIEDKEKALTEDESKKIITEYEQKLKLEKEKSETLKKQLFDYYQKDKDLSAEKEKATNLENKLQELKSQYSDLEIKYNNKTITKEEKENIQKEYEKIIADKYEIDKQKSIQQEKEKVRKEFEQELIKMKDYIANLKIESNKTNTNINADKKDTNNKIEYKNQIFGRITDIINDTVSFQFIALDTNSKVKVNNGDNVQIIRLLIDEGVRKEILIGYLKIISVNSDSLYGTAKIVSFDKGIQLGDLLKN